jgi:hypothetical protein
MDDIQKTERASDVDIVDEITTEPLSRKEHHGVTLIPRPSDDPSDPLVRPQSCDCNPVIC